MESERWSSNKIRVWLVLLLERVSLISVNCAIVFKNQMSVRRRKCDEFLVLEAHFAIMLIVRVSSFYSKPLKSCKKISRSVAFLARSKDIAD